MADGACPDQLELHVSQNDMASLQDTTANLANLSCLDDTTDLKGADGTEQVETPTEEKQMEHTDGQIVNAEVEDFDLLKDVHSETTDEVDAEDVSNSEFVCLQPESRLHCALCGNFSKEPKLLPACLHSFCLDCLEKLKGEKHRSISCPMCQGINIIPEGGLSKLMSNDVVSSLISAQEKFKAGIVGNCVVCHLRGEMKEIEGQCQDCGDVLCEDCCEKHTFSRLTASHTVTKLSDMQSDQIFNLQQTNTPSFCAKHPAEELKFFCQDCSVTVCRDCILLEHGKHTSVPSESKFQKVKQDVESEYNTLKSERDKMMQVSLEDSLDMINAEEEKQLGKLQEAKQEVIDLIESKFGMYRDTLQEEFQNCRHYCANRQTYLDRQSGRIDAAGAEIEFHLEYGQLKTLVSLQQLMKDVLRNLSKHLKKTFSPVEESKLPTVDIAKDPIKKINDLNLVGFTISLRAPKDAKQKDESAVKSVSHKSNNKGKPSAATGTKTSPGNKQLHSNSGPRKQTVGSAMSSGSQRATGRGSLMHQPVSANMRATGRGSMLMQSYSSLLGVYPGHGYQGNGNIPGRHGDGPVCPQPFDYSGCGHNKMSLAGQSPVGKGGAMSMNSQHSMGRQHGGMSPHSRNRGVKMQLKATFNCRTPQDPSYVDIVGLTFTNQKVIAVSDANNRNLKLFDVSGEWLDLIFDAQPRTVTFCDNHLVWNSLDEAAVKTYNMSNQTLGPKRQLNVRTHHPVTSYRNTKYIIANLKNHQIQACTVNGDTIHTLVAKDGHGNLLKSVSQIAACHDDQLVLVDKSHNRVVVNNFDGDFRGAYQEPNWLPGCVTIDHLGNIFVTDTASNRLIMLSQVGEFLQAWTTSLEKPFGLACNRNGVLAVSGAGNSVCLYQYQY